MLAGVSMGGSAVLEFARAFPARVCAAAVIAGCYNDMDIKELAQATASIPLLLVHSRDDQACPFGTIQKLYLTRISAIARDWTAVRQAQSPIGDDAKASSSAIGSGEG